MTTESMKPYPAYKDSGIEWIGEIPEHWDMRKVSRSFALIGSGTTPKSNDDQYYQNGDISWIITGDLNDGLLNDSSKKITPKALEDHSTLKIYPKDTIIVAMYGATIGKICITNFEACTNQACCALSESPYLLNRFTFYWFIANKHNIINMSYGGGQPNISQEIVRSLKITTPSLAEQHIIITFLNNQTAKIDTLIENKQKQIELLKEERTAIINQAVTKGLNPDVPMRDSGIEWLGEVPEHWGITKLKFILNKIGSGLTPRGGAEVYQDYGVPLLRSQNVHFDGLRLDDVAYISNETHKSMNRSAVKPDDVLINITGASIGRCAIIPTDFSDGNVNQHVCILRTSENISSKYLHLLLSSQIGQLQVFNSQNGAAREGLNFEQLGDFFVTLPLLNEQEELTRSISIYIDKIIVLISQIQQQIALLQEYRTALISEAVTGKIDLRNQHEFPTSK